VVLLLASVPAAVLLLRGSIWSRLRLLPLLLPPPLLLGLLQLPCVASALLLALRRMLLLALASGLLQHALCASGPACWAPCVAQKLLPALLLLPLLLVLPLPAPLWVVSSACMRSSLTRLEGRHATSSGSMYWPSSKPWS
jgi:hypothetical protein